MKLAVVSIILFAQAGHCGEENGVKEYMDAVKKAGRDDHRLQLSEKDRAAVLDVLSGYLHDKSRTVRMFSMQALANLALDEAKLRPQVIALLQDSIKTGSPVMKSRGRKLLASLKQL
jgi:hypothetical protein